MNLPTTNAVISFSLGSAKTLPRLPWQERHPGRVPRVARLLALAIKLEQLVRDGTLRDYAEAARLGHVSRARVSQIVNLNLLAPDIQEEILFLPPTKRGRDVITLGQIQPITLTASWKQQRRLWRRLRPTRKTIEGGAAQPE